MVLEHQWAFVSKTIRMPRKNLNCRKRSTISLSKTRWTSRGNLNSTKSSLLNRWKSNSLEGSLRLRLRLLSKNTKKLRHTQLFIKSRPTMTRMTKKRAAMVTTIRASIVKSKSDKQCLILKTRCKTACFRHLLCTSSLARTAVKPHL